MLGQTSNRWYVGCADKLIRVFTRSGKLSRTIRGSSDVVRALCKLPNGSAAQFASAGNDAVVRLWTLEGRELAQLHGHENFIYSLAALPTGEVVSSSEDRSVRVWKDTQCIQTITHPAISVWSVAVCPENGDIVTGASDRIVRVFTKSEERQAAQAVQQAFDESVKSSSIPQQAMPDINKEKLPGPEFLQRKSGTKEGQVQMIREANGNVSAHQWSTAAQQWLNVGTVVDAAGSSGRKQEYLGQDYDYVFDVDIEEGKPPLKLPFNLSQNPYEAAQKFIGDNELSMAYIDQVANFIITNTQGATIGQSSAAQPTGSDPWGQESRYRPGETNSTESRPQSRPKVLPQKDYLTITTANFAAIQKKIGELNDLLIKDGRKDLALSPGDISSLAAIIQQTDQAMTKPTTSTVLDEGINLAIKIVTSWPPQNRLPGIDLYRCLAAATPAIITGANTMSILEVLSASEALSPTTSNANMAMLSLRALTNLFSHRSGRDYAIANFTQIHDLVSPYVQTTSGAVNRNIHIALTTLYINFAVHFTHDQGKAETADRAKALVIDLLALLKDKKVVDSETIYRALVALGTLISTNKPASASEVKSAIAAAATTAKEPRIKGVVEEIQAMLG